MNFGLYDEVKQNDDEFYLLTEASDYLKPTFCIEDTLNLLREWRKKVIDMLSDNYYSK